MQLQHSCDLLLGSELFTFHSERMCDLLLKDAQTVRYCYFLPHTPLELRSTAGLPHEIAERILGSPRMQPALETRTITLNS